MYHNPLLNTEIDILVLLLVACLAAIALKKLKFPHTIGLVIKRIKFKLTIDEDTRLDSSSCLE
ncbi:MAG: hypothetical protein QNJ41_04985 [Xenococcaceae cyanobacterium MO_188.B32]|nr:hypothetical protein [Xenococcaceae cyanobacterium MO_188.B32]